MNQEKFIRALEDNDLWFKRIIYIFVGLVMFLTWSLWNYLQNIEQRLEALEETSYLNRMERETMKEITITRKDIEKKISDKLNLPRYQTIHMVQDIIKLAKLGLVRDRTLKVTGLGTFKVRHKPQRIGRNLKTKEEVIIKPRKVATFRRSDDLVDKMNQEV